MNPLLLHVWVNSKTDWVNRSEKTLNLNRSGEGWAPKKHHLDCVCSTCRTTTTLTCHRILDRDYRI